MKIISWNCNGLRAVLGKNKAGEKLDDPGAENVLETLVREHAPDVLCLQETKCPTHLFIPLDFPHKFIIESKTRKGYSGVAVFSKIPPLKTIEFPLNEEGRVLCLEFNNFYLINSYTPNSKPDLSRLSYRVNVWEPAIRIFVNKLQEHKPVIFVSDFNVAPTEIDIYNPKNKNKTHGFTPEERGAFAELKKECELIDTFRELHPTQKTYSWFSYLGKARANNRGWRIDMAMISRKLFKKIRSADILDDVYGSDHLPVSLDLYE